MPDVWPFNAWLKLAVIRYGLTPSEFWQMSVHDWRVLTQSTEAKPMRRSEFDALTQKYPDPETEIP